MSDEEARETFKRLGRLETIGEVGFDALMLADGGFGSGADLNACPENGPLCGVEQTVSLGMSAWPLKAVVTLRMPDFRS